MIDNPVALGSSAVISALLIQSLKDSGWATWFTRETDKANLFLSVIVAVTASLGIHFAAGTHDGEFIITGNWHLIGNAVVQWVGQHSAYKGIVVLPEALGETRAVLRDILTALQKDKQ